MNLRVGSEHRRAGGAWRAALAGVLGVTLAAAALAGQGPVRRPVENTNAWYSVFGEHRIRDRWALWYDVHFRRSGVPGERWQQLLIRPGVVYELTPEAKLAAGYAYIVTHQYGDDPIPARFPEHRIWQHLALSHRAGSVALASRFRLEQRYLGVIGPIGTPGVEPEVERWRFTQRLRYQFRATRPFGGPAGPYVTAFDEVFIGLGRDVQLNILEQNRLFVGAGWRFSSALRAETGYMEQQIIRGDGRRVERNHTWTTTVFTTAPFGR